MVSSVCSVIKNTDERSSKSQYRPQHHDQTFRSYNRTESCHHLNRDKIKREKLYRFRSDRFSSDILIVIIPRISDMLDY